jgi:hypothetical protein
MKEAEVSEKNSVNGGNMNIMNNFNRKPECKRLNERREHKYEEHLPALNGMEV